MKKVKKAFQHTGLKRFAARLFAKVKNVTQKQVTPSRNRTYRTNRSLVRKRNALTNCTTRQFYFSCLNHRLYNCTVFSVFDNYARWPQNCGSLFADGQTTEVLESIGPEIAEIRRPCRKLCSGQKDRVTNPRRLVYRTRVLCP